MLNRNWLKLIEIKKLFEAHEMISKFLNFQISINFNSG